MRILLPTYYEYAPDPDTGGIGTYTRHLAHGLVELGHEVHVIVQGLATDFTEDAAKGIRVHKCPVPASGSGSGSEAQPNGHLTFRSQLRRRLGFLAGRGFSMPYDMLRNARRVSEVAEAIIHEKKIDVIEVPECSGQGYFIKKHFRDTVGVVKFHTPMYFIARQNREASADGWGMKWATRIEGAVARAATVCTSPSGFMAEEAGGLFGVNGVQVIPNGINIGEIDAIPAVGLDQYGVGPGRQVILYVGSMQRRKVGVFLDAVPKVLANDRAAVFVFVGRDVSGFEGTLRSKVAEEVGLPVHCEQIKFLGKQSYQRVIGLLKASIVFVHPPVFENFPYSCMEAMACGTPVVSTQVGGIVEMIESGKSGLLVPPSDGGALAEAILEVLSSRELGERLGLEARERVRTLYDHRHVAAQTLKLYESLSR